MTDNKSCCLKTIDASSHDDIAEVNELPSKFRSCQKKNTARSLEVTENVTQPRPCDNPSHSITSKHNRVIHLHLGIGLYSVFHE